MKRIYAISVALSAVFLISCGLADVTEDSEFMPSIASKVGCYADSGHVGSMYGCYEFCIREDSSFTFVSHDYTNDSLFEGYGKIKIPFDSNLSFGTNGNYWEIISWGMNRSSLTVRHAYYTKEDFDPTFFRGSFLVFPAPYTSHYVSDYINQYSFQSLGNNELSLPKSSDTSLCGQFGALLDTTKYTLDSLAKFAN